jgi:hypothetical protein
MTWKDDVKVKKARFTFHIPGTVVDALTEAKTPTTALGAARKRAKAHTVRDFLEQLCFRTLCALVVRLQRLRNALSHTTQYTHTQDLEHLLEFADVLL